MMIESSINGFMQDADLPHELKEQEALPQI